MDGTAMSLTARAQAERPLIEAQPRRELVKGVALGQDEASLAAWSRRSLARIRYWLGR